MKRGIIVFLTLWCLLLYGCATPTFKRVEILPEGEQTNALMGGLMSGIKDANTIEKVFDCPYKKVWNVCLKVSKKFDKTGKRPFVMANEENGRINNGFINSNSLIGSGTGSWSDAFCIELTSVSDEQTKVSVTRKVVELESNISTHQKTWKTQLSNGKYENWLLTQIEDGLVNEQQ